ncbi:HEAT repeat domain-containing protein [Sphingomonas xinjiangensis]|uniref:HEAT repeat protein n=1 Tax=Sphingomonas xinjiangensis TaxID=643568 RepID=A0A840YGD1_9SPHN|nr:HEAT repeat domain-containing protein [Sphingomonas xinjiangensis]MBB5711039.1 HEAT repeat protein [Sphingomonas xinjiangensis]
MMLRFPAVADELAGLAIQIVIWGSLAMSALILYLVIRRDRNERQRSVQQVTARTLTREIMAALPQAEDVGSAFAHASVAERVAAVSHLSRLLRGDDLDRLAAFVERHELVARLTRRVAKRRLARRVNIVRSVGSVGGPQAVTALNELLANDPAAEVRLEAAAMLARIDALPSARALIEALELAHATVTPLHRALFRALAPSSATELVELLAEEQSPDVQALVADALGSSEDYSVLRALRSAAASPAPQVRIAAIAAISRLGHPGGAAWLIPLLEDDDEMVRAHAARACGSMGLRAAMPRLIALAEDPSPWVRLRASDAAEILGGTA